jgi:hypothetical protein
MWDAKGGNNDGQFFGVLAALAICIFVALLFTRDEGLMAVLTLLVDWLMTGFALLVERPMAVFALVVCIGSLFVLGGFVVSIWRGWFGMTYDHFRTLRGFFAIIVPVYAVICLLRLTLFTPPKLTDSFNPELIAYSIFWVLAPPTWFFVEYFAVQIGWVTGIEDRDNKAKTIKDYADYASKIWAGLVVLLGVLIAFKKPP